ncbi:LlaJI family restriction endonuclease [Metabacillus endolithicus]|uniref:LlaJI family restriction endonuclease n=1 Tax=Metabacillus endolithicus TaxID=1535204 RepID=A0ABW5BSB4_9BACI
MRSAYFRELEKVSFENIKSRLAASDEEVKDMIHTLEYNKRKVIRAYIFDESEEDSEKEQNDLYAFNFVGIAVYKDIVIKCYPKYLFQEYSNIEKDETLKNVIQVLKKYGKSEKGIVGISTDNLKEEFNYLSVIDFIISDYLENGLYTSQKEVYEINGEGEIDWDKTVNETTAFLVSNNPYYFDMVTKINMHNEVDFFRQLHKYVITQCSTMLKRSGLSDILSLPIIKFETDDFQFYDNEHVLKQITKELNVQFISRKQLVLKSLYAYFSRKHDDEDSSNISLFGTMNFNLVWEKTCAFILNNQLNTKLKEIEAIDNHQIDVKIENKTLNQLIPYPVWIPKNAKTAKDYKTARKTIQLDIVSIFRKQSKRYFVIWDAKYYNLLLSKERLEHNPGVEDVIKQYVYYLAYDDFIKKQKFDFSYNVLIFPSETSEIELIGKVDLDFLRQALNITDILLLKIPAKLIFELYLKDKLIDVDELVEKHLESNIFEE